MGSPGACDLDVATIIPIRYGDCSYHPSLEMRHSKEDKAASHERIVAWPPRASASPGTDQPGVAEIMGAAGLTHGGFYKHFDFP